MLYYGKLKKYLTISLPRCDHPTNINMFIPRSAAVGSVLNLSRQKWRLWAFDSRSTDFKSPSVRPLLSYFSCSTLHSAFYGPLKIPAFFFLSIRSFLLKCFKIKCSCFRLKKKLDEFDTPPEWMLYVCVVFVWEIVGTYFVFGFYHKMVKNACLLVFSVCCLCSNQKNIDIFHSSNQSKNNSYSEKLYKIFIIVQLFALTSALIALKRSNKRDPDPDHHKGERSNPILKLWRYF